MQSVPITTKIVSSNLDQARCTTLCDKVCRWLATGRWFSQCPPVSSTNTTDHHDITEILLKVALNTIKQTNNILVAEISLKNMIIFNNAISILVKYSQVFWHPYMFGSSLPAVVWRIAHVLFALFVLICVQWCPTHIVLCFCFVFLRLVYHMLPVSLEYHFFIAPSVLSR